MFLLWGRDIVCGIIGKIEKLRRKLSFLISGTDNVTPSLVQTFQKEGKSSAFCLIGALCEPA